jgi:signal transduction histidine kinase
MSVAHFTRVTEPAHGRRAPRSSSKQGLEPELEQGPAPRSATTTERAVADEVAALRHDIALRDEFISTAAHELRNPISPVYMQLEHLKTTIRASSEPIDHSWLMAQLEAMTARFDRFLETLNRLLDASRLGAGHLVLLPEHCDLVEVTRNALVSAQRELHASGCVVELESPATVTGFWDRLRLEQIVGNLVSNAARYGAGRPVSITIEAGRDEVCLRVRDQGIGIATEDLSRIFQRFERARNVGRSAGFGIGLWVVAELTRAMGGRIAVESELGRGAVFTLTLPRKR